MKKNIIFVTISLIVLLSLGIGLSYSMWNMSNSQDTNNVIATTSECFDISLTNQSNSINLENAYPISDEKGKKLTPFTFTVKNTCDMTISYSVNLESLKDSTLASKFLKVMINNEEIKKLNEYESTDTINSGSIESRILAKGTLSKGDSNNYSLRLWIDYDTTMEDLDNETKILKAKVVIKASANTWNPVSEGYITLHDAILANEYQTSLEKAIEKIKKKIPANLSKTAPLVIWQKKEDTNIYEMPTFYPHPSLVGNSEYGGSKLTNNDTLMLLGKSYEFNQNTGVYTITNYDYYDPTTLDFSEEYYYCMNGINISEDGTLNPYQNTECSELKILKSARKYTDGDANSNQYRLVYYLEVQKLLQEVLESTESDKGLYQDVDDYGDTYYYRGNVVNNNVYFAGFYWKIIRINGNGTIRLIYNGTDANSNGEDLAIGKYAFNNKVTGPASQSYMYGNTQNSLDQIRENTNDSSLKEILDNWYETNILNKNYDSYIGKSSFCNDRSVYEGDGYTLNKWTSYGFYSRINNNMAIFTCPDSRDLFTVSNDNIGNKDLKYPIGVISGDEIVFSGSTADANTLSYLKDNLSIISMSPSVYNQFGNAYIYGKGSNGDLGIWYGASDGNYIRPVISLKADVKISSGIGTSNSPFVVE